MWRVIWFFLGVSRLSITGASPEWCMQRLAKARIAFHFCAKPDDFTAEVWILLLLAILLLCLLAWRLTPHTFEEITASDQNAITSLAGAATFLGVRYGRAYTESYALQNVLPEDTAFEGILMLLNSTRYQEDFRNLLPWPIEAVSAGRAFDGRSVSLMLVWGPSEDECCSLSLSGRQIVVSRPHHDGFLIYHPEDPKLLNWLAIYLANNGEKG